MIARAEGGLGNASHCCHLCWRLGGQVRCSPEKLSQCGGDRSEKGGGRTAPLQGSGCCGPGSSEQAGGQGPPGCRPPSLVGREPGGCRRRPAFYATPGDSQPTSARTTAQSRLHGPCRHQAPSCRCAHAHVDKSPARLQGLGDATPPGSEGQRALCIQGHETTLHAITGPVTGTLVSWQKSSSAVFIISRK